MSQIERLVRLKALLESRKFITKQNVLSIVEVSEATFKRDLEYARSRLHWPIEWDPARQAYFLNNRQEEIEIPGLWLTPSQVQAFLVIDHLLRHLEPGFLEIPLSKVQKRIQTLSLSLSADTYAILSRVKIFRPAARKIEPWRFEKIAKALIERKLLKFTYQSRSKAESTEREVSPQRLVYYRDNWYLDGYCHWRQALRSFSIDQIQTISLLNETAHDVEERALDREFASSYGIFSGSEVRWAVLRFTEERARWVASETWHSEQKTYRKDGFYYLEIPFSDDRELLLDILRFGPEVEVLEPLELREKIQARLQAALDLYKKNKKI